MPVEFEEGATVAVPCQTAPGAFPGEYLVTVETATGPIAGFARAEQMAEPARALRGTIGRERGRNIVVWLVGSFFTTNGRAELAPEWASQHLRVLRA